MLSVILTIALAIVPEITRSFNDEGMVKLRSNASDLSETSSSFTGTLTIVLVDPAVKVALSGAES